MSKLEENEDIDAQIVKRFELALRLKGKQTGPTIGNLLRETLGPDFEGLKNIILEIINSLNINIQELFQGNPFTIPKFDFEEFKFAEIPYPKSELYTEECICMNDLLTFVYESEGKDNQDKKYSSNQTHTEIAAHITKCNACRYNFLEFFIKEQTMGKIINACQKYLLAIIEKERQKSFN